MPKARKESIRLEKDIMQRKKAHGKDYIRFQSLADEYSRIVDNVNARQQVYYSQKYKPIISKQKQLEFDILRYTQLRDLYKRKAKSSRKKYIEYYSSPEQKERMKKSRDKFYSSYVNRMRMKEYMHEYYKKRKEEVK